MTGPQSKKNLTSFFVSGYNCKTSIDRFGNLNPNSKNLEFVKSNFSRHPGELFGD